MEYKYASSSMKLVLASFLIFCGLYTSRAQQESSFQAGEWLKFKLNYSGWVKAGNATLEVKDANYKDRSVFHVIGKGWTTGAIKWFFKVEDRYESYFDKVSGRPYKFIRKINEGGHKKNRVVEFDYKKNLAVVNDLRHQTKKTVKIKADIQDMVSAYYYLRDHYDTQKIKNMYVVSDTGEIMGKKAVMGALTLYLDFINLFIMLLRPVSYTHLRAHET